MTHADYRRYTSKELEGRRARVLYDVKNRYGSFKRGAIVTITRKFSGLEIESTVCATCRVSLFMRKVEPEALELLPAGE